MSRLFSALVPPESAITHLRAELERPEELRWLPVGSWHVTLGFFGDADDIDHRRAWLRRRTGDVASARVRLSGAGRFPGVFWIGMSTVDDLAQRRFARLARAAGAGLDDREFRPHLTVARSRRGRGGRAIGDLVRRMTAYSGPEWTAGEVILFRSEPEEEGQRYTVVDRIALR